MKSALIQFFLKALARLPFCVLYAVADGVAFLLYHVIRYRRKVVFMNLRNSFPEYTAKQHVKIAKQFYKQLAYVVVETIKLLHISNEEIMRRVEFINTEIIDKATANGQSTLLYLGHYGNWEWMQAISLYINAANHLGEVYRPAHSTLLGDITNTLRSRFSMNQLLPEKQAARTMLQWHKQGESFIIGLISDQRPHLEDPSHTMTFLNQETGFITGGELIGRHTEAQCVYLHLERPSRGHYRITVEPIIPTDFQTKYPISEQFMKMLEADIRRQPELWLWSHNRWRHQHNKTHIKP